MDSTNAKKKGQPEDDFLNEESGVTNESEKATNSSDRTFESANMAEKSDAASETVDLELKYNELNDSYLRLMAEFDNYRKRTLREKTELIKNGGETALVNILPVIDDFERALNNIENTTDLTAVEQGVELIYQKFMAYLSQQGVQPIETEGKLFDTELFEAIATVPTADESLKGKVIDCVLTGYTLHDKVIRHSKVVVGE